VIATGRCNRPSQPFGPFLITHLRSEPPVVKFFTPVNHASNSILLRSLQPSASIRLVLLGW
jgi:hypothetical protein